MSLDPTGVKDIIVTSEDTRILLRISELESEINDQDLLAHRIARVHDLRLNLHYGQQCVRDFFICLQENVLDWPDVCSILNFKITQSSTCLGCGHFYESETIQMHIEIDVPPDDAHLNEYVEEFFNISDLVGVRCDACKKFVQKEKRSRLTLGSESEFLLIILTRGIKTVNGYQFVDNRTIATQNVFIRYRIIDILKTK